MSPEPHMNFKNLHTAKGLICMESSDYSSGLAVHTVMSEQMGMPAVPFGFMEMVSMVYIDISTTLP